MTSKGETKLAFDGRPTDELRAAMEANMIAHMAYLPSRLPEASVRIAPDLVVIDAGAPTDTFNVVCGARLDPATADARIAETIGWFRARNAPFSWWVGPCSAPADLGVRLVAHGLIHAEGEVGMALDLARLAAPPAPEGLVVRRATGREELGAVARIVAANWDPPDQAVIDVYERAGDAALAAVSPLRLYVGFLDGEPVGASESFLGHGVVGVYAVCTLVAARRRGVGTALTVAPLLEARALGYRTATLQASEEGARVYARLGFVPHGAFREYKPAVAPGLEPSSER